ncbi:hypothetical protein N7G274_010695 [Stereocaulon virgatum]|uniref:Secreted protein n=1 Tax=Stereocaulon virgatum TaxID=373712 RepID=A0ABR3ZT52_9LECA
MVMLALPAGFRNQICMVMNCSRVTHLLTQTFLFLYFRYNCITLAHDHAANVENSNISGMSLINLAKTLERPHTTYTYMTTITTIKKKKTSRDRPNTARAYETL